MATHLLDEVPDSNSRWDGQADEVMGAELEVYEILTDVLCQLQVVLDERHWRGHQPADVTADEVSQGQHSQQEEVAGQQQVNVLLAEDLSGEDTSQRTAYKAGV